MKIKSLQIGMMILRRVMAASTLLAVVALGLAVPQVANAAPVSLVGAWTSVNGAATDDTSLSGSYNPAAGSDRVMLVAVSIEFAANVNLNISSATFGGQALTEIANNSPAGEGRFALWLGYLDEAGIAAASGNTLTVNWSDNSNASSRNLFAATYSAANQFQPVKDLAINATGVNAPISFGSDVDFLRESSVFYIAGYGGTNAATTHAGGFTERLAAANRNGSVTTVADLDDTSLNGAAVSTTSVDFSGTNGNHGLIAVAVNPVFRPLVHSSASTGSTKWSGSGGWGVTGGQYGEFSCGTCHGKNTGNIKRVKASITAPSGSFPGGAVNFQTAESPTSDFGDDVGAHNSSTKVCEVCHTYDVSQTNGVKFHAFDMSAGGADLTHENGQDCIDCHLHKDGFAAGSCDGCHQSNGVGHSDASENASLHDAHTTSSYTTSCSDCHTHNGSGGDHNNGTVNFNNTAISNTYNYAKAASFGGTCGATNGCHDSDAGEWAAGDLGNAADNACEDCHGSSAGYFALLQSWTNSPAGPTTGEHSDHIAKSAIVTDCSVCHPHDGATLDGQHADTTLQNSVSYNSGNGTCSNSCHNVVDGRDWTSGTALNCADCHNAPGKTLDQGAWPPSSGSHAEHVNTGDSSNRIYGDTTDNPTVAAYDFGCGDCHSSVGTDHMNGSGPDVIAGVSYALNSCSTADCHSHKDTDGVTTVYVPTPTWGASFAGDTCAGCHHNSPDSAGHEEHQMGFHSEHVYSGKRDFLPVTNADPLPANLVLGPADNGDADPMDDSRDPIRGHGGKLSDGTITSTIFTCYVCHNNTVTSRYNDQATRCNPCHDGTNTIAPTMGDMVVNDKRYHVNGVNDVVFVNDVIRSKAQVRDDLADVPEIANNWTRVGVYKANDGSSYDESPQTLRDMATAYGGWDAPSKTCMISCHLWETGRVDKYPIHWIDNSIHGSQTIMCIDCHTRLPK